MMRDAWTSAGGAARDAAGRFAVPLLYVAWDEHLMFGAPVCLAVAPDMRFEALLADVLPRVYGAHPDFARIDWTQVQWLRSGQVWTPDPQRSLHDNGLRHKDVLRLRTPGLGGLGGNGF